MDAVGGLLPGMRHIFNAIISGRNSFRDSLAKKERTSTGNLYYSVADIWCLVRSVNLLLTNALSKANDECLDVLGVTFSKAYSCLIEKKRPAWTSLSTVVSHDIIGILFGIVNVNSACVMFMNGLINISWNKALGKFNVTKLNEKSDGFVVPFQLESDLSCNNFHKHICSAVGGLKLEIDDAEIIISEVYSSLWTSMFSLMVSKLSKSSHETDQDQECVPDVVYKEVKQNGLSVFVKEQTRLGELVLPSESGRAFNAFEFQGVVFKKRALKSGFSAIKQNGETAVSSVKPSIKYHENLSKLSLLAQDNVLSSTPKPETSFGRKMECKIERVIESMISNVGEVANVKHREGIAVLLGQSFVYTLCFVLDSPQLLELIPAANRYKSEIKNMDFPTALVDLSDSFNFMISDQIIQLSEDVVNTLFFASMIYIRTCIFAPNHSKPKKKPQEKGCMAVSSAISKDQSGFSLSVFELFKCSCEDIPLSEKNGKISNMLNPIVFKYMELLNQLNDSDSNTKIKEKLATQNNGICAAIKFIFSKEELNFCGIKI
ncbi:Hypothetical predicted protein [Paramuricea clavata]|uniref:Uncharacterized protein n=1 Tax=Paramuricea clavata TaxID=317549 RepID=A0A7D9IXZ4_PARCT|nr:Hypothetical predicted protein [Paramuricea clavata]